MFKDKKELDAIMSAVMPPNDEISHWARIGLRSKVHQATAFVKSASNDTNLLEELAEIESVLGDKIEKYDMGLL